MNRHKCRSKTNEASSSVSKNDKDKVKDKCVLMCAKDLRPFNLVGGEGFLELAQELIDIGAKYGKIDAASILPHPTTVSRYIGQIADQYRQEIIPKINEAIALKQCAMTCDLWTDNYRKLHYLTMTTNYIEESEDNWKIKTNVLLTTKFPDISKTGEHILSEIQEQLTEIGISFHELSKITFVTDQGSNIRKALEDYERLPCIAHCLNTTLRHTLDEKFLNEEVPNISSSIQSARKTVGFMKRSGLVTRLQKTLKQDIETRWNSIFILLTSLQSQYEDVANILLERGKLDLISLYNKQLMEEIINFLKLFKNATDELEGEKEPTIPFVVPWTYTLLNHCKVTSTDIEPIQKIKKRAEKFLTEKVFNELQNIHYMATFLHPLFKELPLLSDEQKQQIYQDIRQMCNDTKITDLEDTIIPPPAKKFREWQPSYDHQIDEIEKYINMSVLPDFNNVLTWWKTHSLSLPKMAKIAKRIFCIPASSASSERNFSKAGLIITDRRSTIDLDCVNDILFIHHNKCY